MAPGLVARMVAGFVLVLAGTTHAERRAVAVIDLSASDLAKDVARDLSTALNNHADLKPLDNPQFNAALQGRFDDEDEPHVLRAKQYKQEADDFLDNTDDGNAAKKARDGMDELANVQPTSQNLALYADLAFALGQANVGLRKPNDASRAFQLALRLDPGRNPDPTRYQPNIIAAYKTAATKPTIAAKVTVTGAGRVWIDGIEQGPAGTELSTTEGLHLIQLTGPERETRGDLSSVPLTAPLQIPPAPANDELKVKRARIALANSRDPAERASMMKKLAKLLGVEDAVLIAKEGPSLTVQTWRNRDQGFSALVVYHQQKPSEILGPLAPPPPHIKIEKTFDDFREPPPIIVEKRWYQKTWVRASIAGGVAAAIISAILYARREQTLPPWNMDIQSKEKP